MSYEKDKLDSYLTSASLTTALAPYITSASVSAAIAGLDLAPYMTSNSISAAVATDALTVRGTASVSATLSAGAVTVAGYPVGVVLLGSSTLQNVTEVKFSGSWSDIAYMEFRTAYSVSGSSTASIQLFTDGGTTPFLAVTAPSSVVGLAGPYAEVNSTIHAVATGARKAIDVTIRNSGGVQSQFDYTSTANTGVVNCFRYSQSRTISSGYATLIGYRKI
jgi:hypothetical protein